MKRLIAFTVLLAILTALPFSVSFGQLPEYGKTLFFAGVKSEGGTAPIYGAGGSVTGSNFWVFGYTSPSNDTAVAGDPAVSTPLSAEVGYLYPVSPKLNIGITVSPLTIDWSSASGAAWNTYITNMTGGLLTYNISPHIGIAGWGRYKFQMGSQTAFKERMTWAVVGYWRI